MSGPRFCGILLICATISAVFPWAEHAARVKGQPSALALAIVTGVWAIAAVVFVVVAVGEKAP